MGGKKRESGIQTEGCYRTDMSILLKDMHNLKRKTQREMTSMYLNTQRKIPDIDIS